MQRKLYTALLAVALMASGLPEDVAFGQAQGDRTPGKLRPRDAAPRPALDARDARPPPPRARGNALAPARGADAPDAEGPETSTAAQGREGWLTRLRRFVKTHLVWILVGLGVVTVASVTWFMLAGKRRGGGSLLDSLDDELEAAPRSAKKDRRYSSTRISASDVEARLGGPVVGTEVETDREYALVVEEDALKTAKIDQRTGRELADDEDIRDSIRGKDFKSAYEIYCRRIENDGSVEFREDVERALSEHFLRRRDFRKAARILEHHVATHASEDIQPRVYFNLGYIHVLTKTYNKSRRFFRLFIRAESNPQYVARARSIVRELNRKLGTMRN